MANEELTYCKECKWFDAEDDECAYFCLHVYPDEATCEEFKQKGY